MSGLASRYKDPPGIDSIAVGSGFEQFIAKRHRLVLLPGREDQLAHGDAMSCGAESPIYHEIKHDPHSQYGHLMIEVAANRMGDSGWHLGGILSGSDAHYYWQGDEAMYWRFAKEDLLAWAGRLGIVPTAVLEHLAGKKIARLKDFQGTMLRLVMAYQDANSVGLRIEPRARRRHTYPTADGLEDSLAVTIDVLLDEQAHSEYRAARIEQLRRILGEVREGPLAYDSERPADRRPRPNGSRGR